MEAGRRLDYVTWALILALVAVTLYISREFISTVLLSIVLTYLLKPLYAKVHGLTSHRQVSSFLSISAVFLVIFILILVASSGLYVEISGLLKSEYVSNLQLSDLSEGSVAFLESHLPASVSNYAVDAMGNVDDSPRFVASKLLPILETGLSGVVSSIPIFVAHLIVIVFFTYYILIDGASIVDKAVELIPPGRRAIARHFIGELNRIFNTLFTVYFTTSMLSGILAAVGFFMLGVSNPILWGLIVAVFTLIPILGPVAVYVPISLYYLVDHQYIRSLALFLFGAVFLTLIPENILRPHLAKRSAAIHPILTLLAYTAPVFVVGVMGVIIGPVLYGLLLAVYRTAIHFNQPPSGDVVDV